MILRTIDLGKFKPRAETNHAETFDSPVVSASQSCNCINLAFSGNELSFRVVIPDIPPIVLSTYQDDDLLQTGIQSVRHITGKLASNEKFDLTINFATYVEQIAGNPA